MPESSPANASIQARLQAAAAHFQQGRMEMAENACEAILKRQPKHFDCLHLLSAISLQRGRYARAAEAARQALAVNPGSAECHYNLGVALRGLGQPEPAAASYGKAIALRPGFLQAHVNLGNVMRELQRPEAAVASYDRALGLRADLAEVWHSRGLALQSLGQTKAAVDSYERALRLQPNVTHAWYSHAVALQEDGRREAALASYDRAVALRPDFAEAHCNRGLLLQQLGRLDAALASYDRAIAVRPDFAAAHYNRGMVLHALRRLPQAVASYDRALAAQPDFADAHHNRGDALREDGRLNEAIVSYDRAIARQPGFAMSYWNKAAALLLGGRFEEAWPLFEWRLRLPGFATLAPQLSQRPWRGDEPLAGKTILLHGEQGLGDTLQFCRYAGPLAAQGARVILLVQPPLRRMLQTLDGAAQIVTPGEALPAFDYHCPLMSLPFALRTRLETVPAAVPYLGSEPAKARHWADKLGPRKGLRVGLVWSGGFRSEHPELWATNERRNLPLALCVGLNLPGVEFFSLQKGDDAVGQLRSLERQGWEGPKLIDHTAELEDFSDTAALIEQLDLVISVDTSTAHLAGAMNKPLWILNRHDTCWRWMLEGDLSPWYPSARLFRQTAPGDWHGVLQRVRNALAALAEARVTNN